MYLPIGRCDSKNKGNVRVMNAKPNAQLLVYAMVSHLPAKESVVSVFKFSFQEGIINNNTCRSYTSLEEGLKDSQLITLKELLEKVKRP